MRTLFILLILTSMVFGQTTTFRDGIEYSFGWDKEGNFFLQRGAQKSIITPGQTSFQAITDSAFKKEVVGIEDAENVINSTKVYKTKTLKAGFGWKNIASWPDSVTKRTTVVDTLGNKTVIEWKEVNQEKIRQTEINKKLDNIESVESFEWMSKGGDPVVLQKLVAYLWKVSQEYSVRIKDLEARVGKLEGK